MAAITVVPAPADMDSKALLEQAEISYRFGKFADAYRDSKHALEKDEFSNWKDKKKHDAVKSLIRYGYHANGCALFAWAVSRWRAQAVDSSCFCRRSEVLKWLQKRKTVLPDYPLHVCEWCVSFVACLVHCSAAPRCGCTAWCIHAVQGLSRNEQCQQEAPAVRTKRYHKGIRLGFTRHLGRLFGFKQQQSS